MECFIVVREGGRKLGLLRRVSDDSIAGFKTADAAWEAVLEEARMQGAYRASKVERVTIPDEPEVVPDSPFRV